MLKLCNAEMTFLAALKDLVEHGATDLESEIACVVTGLGNAGVSDADDLSCIGEGLGGGFDHTSELHVMKFKQAMQSVDKDHWMKVVDEEHEGMHKHKVWQLVDNKEVPKDANILTSTWAMNKKNNGKF